MAQPYPSECQSDDAQGDQCGCRLLAAAVGAATSTVDVVYCRNILQKRWRVKCIYRENYGEATLRQRPVIVPPHDVTDPVHAIMIANTLPPSD